MKFKGEPNLHVRIASKINQRLTGRKHFSFDNNGEFETENENLIKLVSQHYEIVTDEVVEDVVEDVIEVEEVPELEEVVEVEEIVEEIPEEIIPVEVESPKLKKGGK